jgi:uncharacterized membrane-anchored protein YhcB (DUF1043 family)
MNNQLNNQLNNHLKNNKNILDQSQESIKKVCQIDKNMLKTLIVEWLSLDDQLKSYREIIKDMTEEKKQFEILYHIEENTWNGNTSIQLKVIDIR